MLDEIEQKIEELELREAGLHAKLLQLLKWGGLILKQIDVIQRELLMTQGQIRYLSPIKNRGLLDEVIAAKVNETLSMTGGNQVKAAKVLGLSRRSLLRRIEKYSIEARK